MANHFAKISVISRYFSVSRKFSFVVVCLSLCFSGAHLILEEECYTAFNIDCLAHNLTCFHQWWWKFSKYWSQIFKSWPNNLNFMAEKICTFLLFSTCKNQIPCIYDIEWYSVVENKWFHKVLQSYKVSTTL